MITVGSPDRSTANTSGASSGSAAAGWADVGVAGSAPSDQDASAGRISVEMYEPDRQAEIASAASDATAAASVVRRTQPETLPAQARSL